ncbi:MAG: CAP domain-containing protein [Legionella sp.]
MLQKWLSNGFIIFSLVFFMPHAEAVDNHSVEENQRMQLSILHYINQYRASRNLPPLKLLSPISREAARHSQQMAAQVINFGHQNFQRRMATICQQIKTCNGGAENVAYYRLDAKALVDEWIASPGHRHNIEGHYNLTGIGIAFGKKGWAYYTQIFIRNSSR